MLSRVANSLYWMVRYFERADNLARLIQVNEQLLLDTDHRRSGGLDAFWRSIVLSTGDDELFTDLFEEGTARDVIEFLTSDLRNPNSISSCVSQTRENARMIRDQLSEELWEEINGLYLLVNSPDGERILAANPPQYYEMIRRAAYGFHGVAASTTYRNQAWDFMDLGRHLERADKTTRFLDIPHFLPRPQGDEDAPVSDHWVAILRSCGGLGAFRVEYRGEFTQENVVSFLLFSREFPRSVRFCVDRIDSNLHNISGSPRGTFANDAERYSGRLLSALSYGSVKEVFEIGLHAYLDDLQTRFNEIAEDVFNSYVLLPEEIDERPAIPANRVSSLIARQMEEQQQQQ